MKRLINKNLSILIFFFLINYFAFGQSNEMSLEKTVIYYNQRNEAINLVKSEEWQDAIKILKKLTAQNNDDGDLFYLLGESYYKTEHYQKSINALKSSLSLGGSRFQPFNDIMIEVAKAYALKKDKKNVIKWLQKGFKARYDEKPFLIGSPAFKEYSQDHDFLEVLGIYTETDISREEAWKKDINYLVSQIKRLHYNMYHSVSKAEFENLVADVSENISALTDEQIIVKLMKIVGALGNGHNVIIPTSQKKNALKQLPVQFYYFNEGMYIVNAEKEYEKWIGYKVEFIENIPIKDALKKTNTVNARDNAMQTLWLGSYYLSLPAVLEGLNIIKDPEQVNITLKRNNGIQEIITLKGIDWNFSDFPKLPAIKAEKQPLYLSKKDKPYWSKVLNKHSAMYVQFNAVQQKKEESLEDFNVKIRKEIKQNNIQNLILDLRHNHGGNGAILPPMLKTVIEFEIINPQGRIFVLIGRETFSAAQNLLNDITKITKAILVGEPSGSRPSFIGEAGYFKLPYSGLLGIISSQYHQLYSEDYRKWLAPQIPVSLSAKDYFSGNDKALNAIFEVIKNNKN